MKRKEISQPGSWETGLLVAIIQIISGLVSNIPLGCAVKRLGRCALTLETDSNLRPDILCRQQSFLLRHGKVTPSPRLIAPDEHGVCAATLSITSARREGGRGLTGHTSKASPATLRRRVYGGRVQFNIFSPDHDGDVILSFSLSGAFLILICNTKKLPMNIGLGYFLQWLYNPVHLLYESFWMLLLLLATFWLL